MPSAIKQAEHASRTLRRFETVRHLCGQADEASRRSTLLSGDLGKLRGMEDTAAVTAEETASSSQSQRPQVVPTPQQVNAEDKASNSAAAWFLIATPFAVWVVDSLLMYPLLDFWLNPAVQGQTRLAAAAAIPFALILMELGIGILRRNAYAKTLDGDSRSTLYFWKAVSGIFVFVLPAGAVVTYFVSDYGFSLALSVGFVVMLASLSLVCHVVMLYGGPEIVDSIAERRLNWKISSLNGEIAKTEQVRRQRTRQAGEAFVAGVRDLGMYNTAFPGLRLEAGPFDLVSRRVLREHFGYDVIQQPEALPQFQAEGPLNPPGTSPGGPQATAETGEPPISPTPVDERVRENERQVRP